ncbi:MAG: pantetheine-phosphate adenylyltransferase [Pseudoflavonifractor sp.]|nr:pantetheine-phosphate adenylyltransferase [Pseudoflavonifractor sp.]
MTHRSPDSRRVAIYPGSFDPFTTGHLSIVERGLALFDKIIIAIGVNDAKRCYHTLEDRLAHITALMKGDDRVEVISYTGLTVKVAREVGAGFILRGVRTVADYEYERNMAYANRNISGIETVLLYTLPELSYISSSMVRDLEHNGYDVSPYVPVSRSNV